MPHQSRSSWIGRLAGAATAALLAACGGGENAYQAPPPPTVTAIKPPLHEFQPYEDIVANVGDTLHFAYASFHHVRAKPSLRSKEQRSPHCRVLRAGRDARGQRQLRFLFRHHG